MVHDSPTSLPNVSFLGPTLAPTELAGNTFLALFGRAEAKDFADMYVLAQRFRKRFAPAGGSDTRRR